LRAATPNSAMKPTAADGFRFRPLHHEPPFGALVGDQLRTLRLADVRDAVQGDPFPAGRGQKQ
jgi:hypothetical protein